MDFGDEPKRRALIAFAEEGAAQAGPDGPMVWVPHSVFFEGNRDPDSIWCNVDRDPYDIETPRAMFDAVAAREEVTSVWIMLSDWNPARPEWPYSNTALIVTDAPVDAVAAWFAPFTQIVDPAEEVQFDTLPVAPARRKGVALYWD